MIELGQSVFGNKWEDVEAPHWMEAGLNDLREVIAPGQSWWESISNEVFDMRPYYWGECVCGFERAEWAWGESHYHAEDCYQGEVRAAKLAAGWTASGILDLLDAPKRLSYAEQRQAEDGIYRDACARHGLTYPSGCAVHCTCSHDREWQEWRAANDHSDTCPIILPNFLHKPTGLAVHWYKHIGRSMTCNRTIDRAEWRKIVGECLASVAQ